MAPGLYRSHPPQIAGYDDPSPRPEMVGTGDPQFHPRHRHGNRQSGGWLCNSGSQPGLGAGTGRHRAFSGLSRLAIISSKNRYLSSSAFSFRPFFQFFRASFSTSKTSLRVDSSSSGWRQSRAVCFSLLVQKQYQCSFKIATVTQHCSRSDKNRNGLQHLSLFCFH